MNKFHVPGTDRLCDTHPLVANKRSRSDERCPGVLPVRPPPPSYMRRTDDFKLAFSCTLPVPTWVDTPGLLRGNHEHMTDLGSASFPSGYGLCTYICAGNVSTYNYLGNYRHDCSWIPEDDVLLACPILWLFFNMPSKEEETF